MSDDQAQAVVADATPTAIAGKKICILGYRSHPYGGGQGIYIKYLSKALVEAGHQVDVISGQPYPQLDEGVRLIKMPGMNLFENGLASLRPHHLKSWTNIIEWSSKLTGGFAEPLCFGRRVNKYLKQYGHQYDLIHDNQSLSYGMLDIQKRLPLVTTLHHPITSDLDIALNAATGVIERLLIKRWHSFLDMQAKVVKQLDHIVTVSERSRVDIAKAFGVPQDRIELVYNGIDTSVFKPMPHITKNPWRIMATASADAPLKGLRYLLEAYASLLSQYPQLELLVVGKPKPDGETQKRLCQLNIEQRVQFVSGISTDDLVAYYAEASMVVVPSLYEGFGLPAGEAMACGVPVISTNGGALPEVVGEAGLTVDTADSQAIADNIERLLNDKSLAEQLAHAGRERILKLFCWSVAAQQMSQYYQDVIDDYANR